MTREFTFKIKLPRLARSRKQTVANLLGAGLAVACAAVGFGLAAALGTGAVLVWLLGLATDEDSTQQNGATR